MLRTLCKCNRESFSWLRTSHIAHAKFTKVVFLHLSVVLFTGGGLPGQVTPWGRYTPLGRYIPGRYTPHSACWDTVNKRAVRILLECFLVFAKDSLALLISKVTLCRFVNKLKFNRNCKLDSYICSFKNNTMLAMSHNKENKNDVVNVVHIAVSWCCKMTSLVNKSQTPKC